MREKNHGMLLSMTGFGRAQGNYNNKRIVVEIRAVNGKFSDVRFRLPSEYKAKEADLRTLILGWAERGKLEVSIDTFNSEGTDDFTLNQPLFRRYYAELSQLSVELQASMGDVFSAILRLPNVVMTAQGDLSDEEYAVLKDLLREAFDKFNAHRATEGEVMARDLRESVELILKYLSQVDPHERERIERIRQRLNQTLEENVSKDRVDESRFEQEVLYYLEKLDINEEKVRLQQHCKYFLEVLATEHTMKGKKLGFISQEMGREINTMGAKAYSSDLQRLVVEMKNELEKIKEQIANAV